MRTAAGPGTTVTTSGPTALAFNGKAHGLIRQGNKQRKASAREKIAKQMRGHPTTVHWNSRKRGANPRNKNAEPTKGEEDCSHASKLQMCLWM